MKRAATTFCAALVGVLLAWGAAQPYAAAGGFDRPERLLRVSERPQVAVTLDHGTFLQITVVEGATRFWDADGGEQTPPGATHAGPSAVRALEAAGGSAFHAGWLWSERDLTTGRYRAFTDDGALLWETGHAQTLVPVMTEGGLRVFSQRARGDGGEVLELRGNGDGWVLFQSTQQVMALSAALDAEGTVHLTWLEGFNEITPFGLRGDWSVYTAAERAGGWTQRSALGKSDGRALVTITQTHTNGVQRLWVGEDGRVQRSMGAEAETLLPGRPLGATANGDAYLTMGDKVVRIDATGETTTVAWSPVVVLDAWLVEDAEGTVFLRWLGAEPGGGWVLYGSNNRTPLSPTWVDRLAAALGLRPWNVAEQILGQAASGALAGVLAATSSLPIFWLLGFLVGARDARRARALGAALAVGLLWLMGVGSGLLAPASGTVFALYGGAITLAVAPPLGGGLAWLAWSRRDVEPLPGFIGAGVTTVGLAVAAMLFVGFGAWTELGLFR